MGILSDAIRAANHAERLKAQEKAHRARCAELKLAWALGMQTLYKFRSVRGDSLDHVIETIQQSRIYFPSPSQFNDPFDCAPRFELSRKADDPIFVEEAQRYRSEWMKAESLTEEQAKRREAEEGVPHDQLPMVIREQVRRDIASSVRIFCLSGRRDHPLLWSHYADSHRGVCLHFSTDSLLKSDTNPFRYARRVDYREERTPFFIPLADNSGTDLADIIAYTKASFWSYEEEYRIVCHGAPDFSFQLDEGFLSFYPPYLEGISFGLKIEPEIRAKLIDSCRKTNRSIALYQALENHERFGLEFEPIVI